MTPRTRCLLVLAAAATLAPLAAMAAGAGARDVVLDFQRSGPMRDLLGKSLGVAKSFLFLAAFLGYALEAFGRSPTAERDYGAVTWRVVVVLFLLWNYQPIFGSVINLVDRIEQEVAPPSTWDQLRAAVARNQTALEDLSAHGETAQPAGTGGQQPPPVRKPSTLTSWVYEALVTILQLLGEGLVFLIRWMSRILTATLFILGPLALVAGIPRMSSTGSRWFLRFVTIASWPIFAGVLLAVLVALGGQGAQYRSYLQCLVASLVMLVTALATPSLASHVVGGALQNFAGTGFGAAKTVHRDAVVPASGLVVGVARGAKGLAAAAAQAVAAHRAGSASAGGQNGRGPGSGSGRGGQGSVVANSPEKPAAGGGTRGRGRGTGGNGARGGAATPAGDRNGSGVPGQGGVVANPPVPPPKAADLGNAKSPGGGTR
jgi:hypothetical protein